MLQISNSIINNRKCRNLKCYSLWKKTQKELQDLRNDILRGKLIRSRAKWIQEGEKPTNYFCNLENRNYVSKLMIKLYAKIWNLLSTQETILSETMNHYKFWKTSWRCLSKWRIFLNFCYQKAFKHWTTTNRG